MSDRQLDSEELCRKAGVDSGAQLTRFTMGDAASALIGAGYEEGEAVRLLREAYPPDLGNAICEASDWSEILVTAMEGA